MKKQKAEKSKALAGQLRSWRARTFKPPLGQAEAAARLGVNLRTYQDWEQGRFSPRGIALQAVLERIEGKKLKAEMGRGR